MFAKLLSFFRPKSKTFRPVNRLESLLEFAAAHPEGRAEFVRQLFHFDLCFLGSLEWDGEKKILKLESQEINGETTLFAYTSEAALSFMLRQKGLGQKKYIRLSAKNAFLSLQSQRNGFILNAGLDFGKHFTASEVARMGEDPHEEMVVPAETSILIGQPSKGYPRDMIALLKLCLKRNPAIKDIYLGWITLNGSKPEYYALVEMTKGEKFDRKQVSQDLGSAIGHTLAGETILFQFGEEPVENGALISVSKSPDQLS